MTAAQATIRRLYEQVRVLETETARPPTRRARLPYAGVLLAALVLGAVSASVSHSHAAAALHAPPARAAAPVAHLIDPPAERARALPAAPRHRVVHHVAKDAARHDVTAAAAVVASGAAPPTAAAPPAAAAPPVAAPPAAPRPAPVRPAAPAAAVHTPVPVPVPAPVPAPAPARTFVQVHEAAQTAHATQPVHAAAPQPAPARHAPARHAPARPVKTVPASVGIGSVVVSTSDEPLPDDAGATSTTTTP
ncbi:MAG: hypothetical protein ACJ77E_18730 [Gaiellaceae bacterium]